MNVLTNNEIEMLTPFVGNAITKDGNSETLVLVNNQFVELDINKGSDKTVEIVVGYRIAGSRFNKRVTYSSVVPVGLGVDSLIKLVDELLTEIVKDM